MLKEVLIFGFLMGLVLLLSSHFTYSGVQSSFYSFFIVLIIFMVLMILGTLFLKKKQNGYITFIRIFIFCSSMTLVGMIIGEIGDQLYWKNMSQEAQQNYLYQKIDKKIDEAEEKGEVVTIQKEEEIKQEIESRKNVLESLKIQAQGYIFFLVLAVIIGLIFKKEKVLT